MRRHPSHSRSQLRQFGGAQPARHAAVHDAVHDAVRDAVHDVVHDAARDEPRDIWPDAANVRGAQALADIRYIRDTMARAERFTTASGWGQVAMGTIALVAAWVAGGGAAWLFGEADSLAGFHAAGFHAVGFHAGFSTRATQVWLAACGVAVAVAVLAMRWKAHRVGLPLVSGPARRFAQGFLPPLLAGAALSVALHRAGQTDLLPAAWLLTYGAGILAGGMASVPLVPAMGACFLVLGWIAVLAPAAWGNALLAIGFGLVNIGFGIVIAGRHGG